MIELAQLARIIDIEFPKHFHEYSQDRVRESRIDEDPNRGLRQFMDFVRSVLSGARGV